MISLITTCARVFEMRHDVSHAKIQAKRMLMILIFRSRHNFSTPALTAGTVLVLRQDQRDKVHQMEKNSTGHHNRHKPLSQGAPTIGNLRTC